MTPKRLAALKWVHAVGNLKIHPTNVEGRGPSNTMQSLMLQDHQIVWHRGHYVLSRQGIKELEDASDG